MEADIINGLFELGAAIACCFHIKAIIKDKVVKGFNTWAVIFYTGWGIYNLYFYPHLGQWFSFTGGVCIALCNIIWIGLILKYKSNKIGNTK